MSDAGPGQPNPSTTPSAAEQPESRAVRVRQPNRRPVVTFTIMGITILVYLVQYATNAGIGQAPFLALGRLIFGDALLRQLLNNGWGSDLLVLLGGMNSALIQMGQVWRLLTPALLHLSPLHIASNMYSLYVLGPTLERYYGHYRFLALYVLCALGGNLLSFYMRGPQSFSAGASTAIFGLIAAEGIFIYLNRALFGPRFRAMLQNVVFLIVLNLGIGIAYGFDNWGHLGGLITGLAFGWFAGPHLEVTYNYPEYELVDQRSTGNTVLVSGVILVVLCGLALVRILS